MVNWIKYKITETPTPMGFNCWQGSFILDGYVKYSEKCEKCIWCVNTRPFNTFKIGDEIEIDNDETKHYSSLHPFNNTSTVRKVSSVPVLIGYSEADIRRLRNRISELESSSSNQLVLRRNTENSLIRVQERSEGLQSLVKVGERELSKKNSQIEEKDRQIARRDEQVREKEGQLTISREEARRVTDLFNNLQIESSNKDNQINQKAEELKQKEKEIIELKAQLGTLSPEEVLKRKIAFGEKELDDIVRSLSLNYETTMNLCNAYERFELAQREGNRDDKNNARNNIRNIKQELFTFATQNNISNDDLHKKIYQSCEEIAKLRVELEVLKENQYQARQEVSPYGCNQQ